MTAKLHSTRRRLWKYGATTATLITGLALVLIFALSAAANQQSTSAALAACATSSHLPNSKFEVDAIVPPPAGSKKNANPTGGANLKVDGATGDCIDWLNDAGNGMRAGVIVQPDKQTGSGDDSFGQGTAENDQVPTVVSGSIPPNKSDLSNFGIYQEKEGAQSFLSVFWSRVQNPSGTTNMDFEFNKNKCDSNDPSHSNCSSNGVTPVRSDGDKLLLYDLDSGGSTVSISIRTWNGTTNQWSDADPLNGTEALGSANYDAIPSGESGGLGALSSLTFGEATVDLNVLLGANCGKFGSVYLKSRSSTSFTSEIKDFIAPKVVTISNCSAIATSATNSTMPNAITDTATLTDVTNPTGSITFKVYTDAACTTLAPGTSTITVNSPFTANGSGGYTAQASYTPTAAGTFYWIASYSGDGNNNAVSGSCGDTGETSTVSKANSSMATYENLVPNDTASITPNTATGSVEFYLFKPGQTCSVANEVNAVLHQTRPLSSGSATTNNTSDTDTLAGGTHANAIGTWKWIASYAGDGNLNGSDSICTETFSISN